MRPRFEVETVHGLRDRLTRDAIRRQAKAAALHVAMTEIADWEDSIVITLQRRRDQNYRSAREAVEWLADEPFLTTWCKRINRGRRKDAQKRHRRIETEAKRWAAMTPRQRHQHIRAAETVRLMTNGLLMRDVQ